MRLPLGDRPFPADVLACAALSALCCPEGRTRLRELGVGPEVFENVEAEMIARAIVAGGIFTVEDLDLIWRDDGERLSWGDAIETHPLDPAWAVRIIDLFAREHARRWMPPVLRWAADRMERDHWDAERVAPDVDQLLTLLRPSVLGRAGGAAA